MTDQQLSYYGNIEATSFIPTQAQGPSWTNLDYEEPAMPEAGPLQKSVVTSEFSAGSSSGYPEYCKSDTNIEDAAAEDNTGESQRDVVEVGKSDSVSSSVLASSKGSVLSLGSLAESRAKAPTMILAVTALVAIVISGASVFYTYGASHGRSRLTSPSLYLHNAVSGGVPSTWKKERRLVAPVTGGDVNDAPDRGNFVDDLDTPAVTAKAPSREYEQGRTTTKGKHRKKVAVWEGKRIYGRGLSGVKVDVNGTTVARKEMSANLSLSTKPSRVTRSKLTAVPPQNTLQVTVESRIIRNKEASYNKGKQCDTRVCERESVYLTSFLNWDVKPCTDFYGFVCGHWRELHPEIGASTDTLLVQKVEEDIYRTFTSKGKSASQMLKTEALINTCVRKPFSEDHRSTLLDFMRDMGLRGWPFQHDTKTLIDVWKSAGLLLRHLDLATLVSVSVEVDPESDDKHIIALGEPSLLIGQYGTKSNPLPEWYGMAITTCFKIFTSGKYVQIAKRVRDVAERLAEISVNRGYEAMSAMRFKVVQLRRYNSLLQLLTFVFNNVTVVHSRIKVLVKSERYLGALKNVMHVSKSVDVLNYLGFRALVHISPLLPDQALEMATLQMKQLTGINQKSWPRWRRCIRMFEKVVPVVFLHAYAQTMQGFSNRDKLWALMNEIQANFVLSINSAPWMSVDDKIMLKDKLTKIRLEVFHKFWGKMVHKHSAAEFLPDVEPGSVIIMYKSLARQFVEKKLSMIKFARSSQVKEWKGSVFDTEPLFDRESETVFIPMAMFDPLYMTDSESMLLQLPRVASKVFGALFQGIHQSNYPVNKLKWSVDTEMGYRDMQRCLQNNYENATDEDTRSEITAELNTFDSMSLLPAFKLFLKKVNQVNIEDYGVLTGCNITVKQLFFVLYAKSFCETMNFARVKEVTEESIHSPSSLRVNIPLRNSFRFPTFWECASDTPMNPNQKCTIWTS